MQKYVLSIINSEIEALIQLKTQVGKEINEIVELLLSCKGRFVLSGIGKSALIAKKIVATLNSTGTASLFMHASDAIHGDLGSLQVEDTAMLVSKSGESPEIKALIPIIKAQNPINCYGRKYAFNPSTKCRLHSKYYGKSRGLPL